MGTVLAHVGQGAFSTGARCLLLLGRIYAKRLPNKLMSSDNSSHLQTIQMIQNSHLVTNNLVIKALQ
jgi:hypothetical protein